MIRSDQFRSLVNTKKILTLLTAQRCPSVTDNPIASGPEPANPVLRLSTVAKTVRTSKNVMLYSIIRTWKTSTDPSPGGAEVPSVGLGLKEVVVLLSLCLGVAMYRVPAPTIAPRH